jgi:hypothetical protein
VGTAVISNKVGSELSGMGQFKVMVPPLGLPLGAAARGSAYVNVVVDITLRTEAVVL